MPDLNEKPNPIRELPISLQGIEKTLLYLNEISKKAESIRNISENTGLSMRVVKNILLQLERFNQVERVVEKNNILPKWKITKFGKRVLKEAEVLNREIKFLSKEEELLQGIIIPEKIENIKEQCKVKQDLIESTLNSLQIELSKMLGTVLNLDNPAFEDLMSIIIRRLKFFRQKISNLPKNPITSYKLKKKDEKEKKLSKSEENDLFKEILFFNYLIVNQLKRIEDLSNRLSKLLENGGSSNAFSVAKDLREEIRIVKSLINNRESLNIDFHILSKEKLKLLSLNKYNSDILDDIIDISLPEEEQIKTIEEAVLELHNKLTIGKTQFNKGFNEIKENIPLFALYQFILDEKPNLNINIDQLERVINSLADKGYISGIKVIQGDEDHYLKIVQLKPYDIKDDEQELISHALKFQNFTLTDMIGKTSWSSEKILKILDHLTDLGILKFSKSFLHGNRWYIVSETNS
ncbi:MAG: hypothetical protein ACFFDK_11025 [Promethearchaeota archaeon]